MNKASFVDNVQKPDFLVAFLLFGIAFSIRIVLSPSFALSTDESFTANIALSSSFDEMLKMIWNEGTPPLLYCLLRGWIEIFGSSDQAIKLFGIVLSSLIPPVAYLVTLSIFGARRIAVTACILCLFSPILIRFGNMVRPYSLTCIFSLLSTWAFFELFKEDNKEDTKEGRMSRNTLFRATEYILFTVLSAYSHLWGVLFSFAQAFVVLVQFVRGKWRFENVKTWFLSASISAVLFLPWLFVVFGQLNKDLHPWYHPKLWYEFLAIAPLNLLSYTVGQTSVLVPFYVVMVATTLLFYGSIVFHLKDKKGFVAQVALMALLVSVMTIILAMNDIPYKERYILALSVLSYALIADWLDKMFSFIRNDFLFALIPLCLFSVVWFNQLKIMRIMPEASVGALLTSMQKVKDIQSTHIVLVAYNSFVPEVTRKIPVNQIIAVPFKTPFKVVDWQNQMQGLSSVQNADSIIASLSSYLNQGKVVWFIGLKQSADQAKDPYTVQQIKMQMKLKDWLLKNARVSASRVSNSFDGSAEAIKFTR